MGLLQQAADWLPGRVEVAAGETVTYTRDGTGYELTANPGRTVFASNVEGAARIQFGDGDFLIRASEFVRVGLDPATPQIGDRITRTVAGAEVNFEVQEPPTGEPEWRYSDVARTVFRIHTKYKELT
jgi:hypothetical protein